MSKRNTNDAEVERVVRYIKCVAQEVTLIEMTKIWSATDFIYALERLQIDLPELSKENYGQLRELYRTLRKESAAREARKIAEEANAKRYNELTRQLEELKKPHWSIVPNFWMTAAILILTAVGAVAAVLAIFH